MSVPALSAPQTKAEPDHTPEAGSEFARLELPDDGENYRQDAQTFMMGPEPTSIVEASGTSIEAGGRGRRLAWWRRRWAGGRTRLLDSTGKPSTRVAQGASNWSRPTPMPIE